MPTASNGDRERRKTPSRSPSHGESGLYETLQRFWQRSHYAGDYFGLTILVVAYILVRLLAGEPFHSQFRLDDPRIQHPHAEIERVPVGIYVQLACLFSSSC